MSKKERPHIPNLILSGTNNIESFQNKTLRPIIKMQHELLITSFKELSEKRKIDFSKSSIQVIETHIKISCKRDIAYRNFVLGIIVGHFTIEEYKEYALSASDYNRRIIQIVRKRLLDSIPEFL